MERRSHGYDRQKMRTGVDNNGSKYLPISCVINHREIKNDYVTVFLFSSFPGRIQISNEVHIIPVNFSVDFIVHSFRFDHNKTR